MSKKLFILLLGGVAVSGAIFYIMRKFLVARREDLHLSPATAASVAFLQEKNFGEFPVEIPDDEFESWGM